jgi:predicted permease
VGQPRRAKGALLTASLFRVLGIPPVVGRAFTKDEDEHAKRVTVLSYGFAQSTFGGPERALGRTIFLDRNPYTVIGVMPQLFSFPMRGWQAQANGDRAELYAPVSWSNDDRKQNVSNFDNSMIARLRPNVTIQQANAEVRALLKRVAENYPPPIKQYIQQRQPNFSLESQTIPLREDFTGNVQRPLLLLLAAVGVVLLIGCADVANLMFSRMISRQREFALRAAMGAGSWRLARQTMTEGLVLSVLGGALGFGLAFWTLPLLLRLAPHNLPRLDEASLNWRVMVFVVAVTLATPFFFCLAPLVNTLRCAIAQQLRSAGRTSTQSKYQRLMMSGAVVVQFSLAFVLLATAGLLIRSFVKASEANPGFRPEHVVSVQIAVPRAVYKKPAQTTSFFDQLLARLSTLPGVQRTGAMSDLPMGSSSNRVISIEGHGAATERVEIIFCAGNAFYSLRVPLVRGRLLQPGDELRNQGVTVISEALAKRVWPHGDPIGRRVKFGVDVPHNDSKWLTVIGVVGNVKERLTSNSPRPMMFTTPEDWVREMNVLIRTSGDPLSLASAVRYQVRQLDPSLPIGKRETLDQVLEQSLSAERFRTLPLAAFAVAAAARNAGYRWTAGLQHRAAYSGIRSSHRSWSGSPRSLILSVQAEADDCPGQVLGSDSRRQSL